MKRYANKVFRPVIVLVILVFSAIIFLSFRKTAEAKYAAGMVAHSQEVLFQTASILSTITDNETGSRGYLLTGAPEFLEPLVRSRQIVHQQIDTLRQLTADNPTQQMRIDSLLFYANKRFLFSDSSILIRDRNGLDAAIKFVLAGNGNFYMNHIRRLSAAMQTEENKLLDEREIANEKANLFLNRIIISIIAVIVVLIIILLRKDYLEVSGRKKAEETLKKNEAFLQLMTNSVKDYAIFLLDTNGLIVNWNKGAEQVTGYDKKDVTGKSFEIFYDNEDIKKDEPRRNLSLAKKYGQFETEGMRLRKNGQLFWANVVFIALVNDTGDLGYSVIIRDITERKKVQEQVEYLSIQINQSNDAIYIVDAARKIKSWNLGAENLYGYSAREALDKDPNELLKTVITEDEMNAALENLERREYWTGELVRKTKNGEELFVRSSTSTIKDARGNVSGYVAVSFDISIEKKLRDEVNHLASLVEQSSEAILSIDQQEHIISWNSGAQRLFGFSREEAIGKKAEELGISQISSAESSSIIKDIIELGNWKAEMRFFRKDSSAFFGIVNANAIKNIKGHVTALVFMINDISLRRELEEKLVKYNEELEVRVKQRTEEISKNEQRFRALIENSAEGIALVDKTGSIFYRSPAAYKITGEIPLGHGLAHLHPDDMPVMKHKSEEALSKPETPVEFQGRFKHASGEYAWMEGTLTNLLHINGVNAVVANYRNITNRKLAEEKLIASEEQFRHTLDNMLEGVQIIGFDWKYIYVNDAMAKHGRYPKEEFPGHTVMEKYPGIEKTDIYKIYQRCFDDRLSFHLENEFLYPDGSVAWFELSFQPVPEGLFILSVDITDRKKAEEKLIKSEQLYRNLFENMLHGFSYCKTYYEAGQLKDFIFLGTNHEFELLTGLQQVTGKRISEIMPALLKPASGYADIISRVAQEGTAEKFETHIEVLDKWFSISLYSPEKGYFVALLDNITDRKKVEDRIKKLNTELEERVIKRTEQLRKTNEELEAFSYSVSHDLRAPLRAIIGFTAILEEDYSPHLDDEAKRITSIIKSNTLKMGHLIDDLLTFSRMGRQDIIKTHINTGELVKEIIEQPDIKQFNDNKPVQWNIHALPDIEGDINTIRQVWINLIANAVKYSAKTNMPVIEIGAFSRDKNFVFFIKDNGVGFDDKYKNKLFRVFQRLHSADEFEGTGIGLAIVEKIISKHDGKVWAESEPGKGACFYFSLPDYD